MKISDLVKKDDAETPPPAAAGAKRGGARPKGRPTGHEREPGAHTTRELAASLDVTDAETSMLLEDAIADLEPKAFRLPNHWANQPLPHGCALPPDPQAVRFLEALDLAMSYWPTWGADNLRRYFDVGRARFAAYHVYRVSVQEVYDMNQRAGHNGISADFACWGPQQSDIERDDARLHAGGEPLPPPSPHVETYFIHRVVQPVGGAAPATPGDDPA